MTLKTAIIGASGYTGAELLRLLAEHPDFDVVLATGDSAAGKFVTEIYPHLNCYAALKLARFEDVEAELQSMDAVFCGLPHGEAMKCLPRLDARMIVDLGSDFRLLKKEDYERWYGACHTAPEELGRWEYGLPELFRERIKGARRIANPGCYATASALGAAPLLKAGLVRGPVLIDAASGTSGAGKVPKPGLHFAHVYEDLRAYKVAEHQHTPEIELTLARFSGTEVTVSFTPRLAPISRGIHAVLNFGMNENYGPGQAREAFEECYRHEYFIKLTAEQPGTKDVRGSNFAALSVREDLRARRIIVSVAIDNLVKGAAGQAVQNANLALGLDETAGLRGQALYP